jgi:hypothetical protein
MEHFITEPIDKRIYPGQDSATSPIGQPEVAFQIDKSL